MYRTPAFVVKPTVSNLLEYREPNLPCHLCNKGGGNETPWCYSVNAEFTATGKPCGRLLSKWWKPAIYCKETENHLHVTCKHCKVSFAMKPYKPTTRLAKTWIDKNGIRNYRFEMIDS